MGTFEVSSLTARVFFAWLTALGGFLFLTVLPGLGLIVWWIGDGIVIDRFIDFFPMMIAMLAFIAVMTASVVVVECRKRFSGTSLLRRLRYLEGVGRGAFYLSNPLGLLALAFMCIRQRL
ncbi:hypothetical protein KGM48_03900 [Patescibacteria group bacterium]|nr:hypothetical protein [Patescibacteria group bacterium]